MQTVRGEQAQHRIPACLNRLKHLVHLFDKLVFGTMSDAIEFPLFPECVRGKTLEGNVLLITHRIRAFCQKVSIELTFRRMGKLH
ncbi:hypothetical protein RUM43_010193 [Polyplax serrata]|uniref:Uncharacterized protein n=1 Tax=Polyplax serrata TaxID=468196 RepID=A0AAN8PK88_POLSC